MNQYKIDPNYPNLGAPDCWIVFRPCLNFPMPEEEPCACPAFDSHTVRRVVTESVLPELLTRFRARPRV